MTDYYPETNNDKEPERNNREAQIDRAEIYDSNKSEGDQQKTESKEQFPIARFRKLENGNTEIEMPDLEHTKIEIDNNNRVVSSLWKLQKDSNGNQTFSNPFQSFTIMKDGTVIQKTLNDAITYSRMKVDSDGVVQYKSQDQIVCSRSGAQLQISSPSGKWNFDESGVLTYIDKNGNRSRLEPNVKNQARNQSLTYADGSSIYIDGNYKTVEYSINMPGTDSKQRTFTFFSFRPSLIADNQKK